MALDLERFAIWLLGRSAWPLIFLLALLGVFFLCGCNGEVRLTPPQAQNLSQAQADAGALLQYYRTLQNPDAQLQDLIVATNGRLTAALKNVPDMPLPKVSEVTLATVPAAAHLEVQEASSAAADPPAGVGVLGWGTIASVGLGALWVFGRLAPSIPGVGPVAGGIAELAWKFLANKNQKAADKAAEKIQQTAAQAAPLLSLAQVALPQDASPQVRLAMAQAAQALQILQPGARQPDGPAASIPSGSVGPGASG